MIKLTILTMMLSMMSFALTHEIPQIDYTPIVPIARNLEGIKRWIEEGLHQTSIQSTHEYAGFGVVFIIWPDELVSYQIVALKWNNDVSRMEIVVLYETGGTGAVFVPSVINCPEARRDERSLETIMEATDWNNPFKDLRTPDETRDVPEPVRFVWLPLEFKSTN